MADNQDDFRVFDETGDPMNLFRFKGNRLVATDSNMDTMLNLSNFPVRDDDIFLCSYPKSGCHWVWAIIGLLKSGSIEELEKVEKERYMIELNSFESLAELKSPRILNNHCLLQDQPTQMKEKKIKVVFVYRNVKDVAVSFYYHHLKFADYDYKAPFSNYLKRYIAGLVDPCSIFDYLKEWEEGILNSPNFDVHVLSYEDLKENTVGEITKLSHFLGMSEDPKFIQEVAEATDFETMKKRRMKLEDAYKDNEGQLIMYRKGKTGDWKNHFTVAESEWFDSLIDQHLGQSKLFKFKYEL